MDKIPYPMTYRVQNVIKIIDPYTNINVQQIYLNKI